MLTKTEQLPRQDQQQRSLAEPKLAYTIEELARASGAGRSTLYEEIAAGHLKVRKLGRRTLALHDDAIAWLANLPAA